MHFEVGSILYDALLLSVNELTATDAAFAELARICGEFSSVGVVTCPERFDAELTADMLFPLADRFPRLSPPVLAARMADWCAKNVADQLTLVPSTLGHLNVITSDQFKQLLLRRFCQTGVDAMFSPQLVLYQPQVERVVNRISWDAGSALNWQELGSHAQTSHNPDLRKLISECGELAKPAERMMCLALLSDPELSVDAFLAKYQGRENIPWYVRRFLSDSEAFLAAAATDRPLPECAPAQTALLLSEVLKAFSWSLLSFRSAVARASGGEPAVLFGQALRLIQEFYRFFNHPTLKEQIRQQRELPIESLVELARNCVRQTLHRLQLV